MFMMRGEVGDFSAITEELEQKAYAKSRKLKTLER